MSRIPSLAKYTSPNLFVPRVSWPVEPDPFYNNTIWSDIQDCAVSFSTVIINGINKGTIFFYVTGSSTWPELWYSKNNATFTTPGFVVDFSCSTPEDFGFSKLVTGNTFSANYGDRITFAPLDRIREDTNTINIYTYSSTASAELFVDSFDLSYIDI